MRRARTNINQDAICGRRAITLVHPIQLPITHETRFYTKSEGAGVGGGGERGRGKQKQKLESEVFIFIFYLLFKMYFEVAAMPLNERQSSCLYWGIERLLQKHNSGTLPVSWICYKNRKKEKEKKEEKKRVQHAPYIDEKHSPMCIYMYIKIYTHIQARNGADNHNKSSWYSHGPNDQWKINRSWTTESGGGACVSAFDRHGAWGVLHNT